MDRWTEKCDDGYTYKEYGREDQVYNKLGKLEDLEERLKCSLDLFVKLHEVEGLYCEIEIPLTILPSKTVYLEIDRLGLDGIHFKKNEYELYFIEYDAYKECFWIKRDKEE